MKDTCDAKFRTPLTAILQHQQVADLRAKSSGYAGTDNALIRRLREMPLKQFELLLIPLNADQGQVGLDQGVVIIAPDPRYHLTDAWESLNRFSISNGNQLMPPPSCSLHDNFRSRCQGCDRFGVQ